MTLPFVMIWKLFRWLLSSPTKNGYIRTKSETGRDHFEHRVRAEEVLCRRLKRWEVVHHISGVKDDNRVANLCVMSDRNHNRYHDWFDWYFKNYGRYPQRKTQLKKLKNDFNGQFLHEFPNLKTDAG